MIRFHRVGDLLDCARELFVGLQPITHRRAGEAGAFRDERRDPLRFRAELAHDRGFPRFVVG